MPNVLFAPGREGFADGTVDWDTHQFKVYAVDLDDCGAAAGGWNVSTHDNAATVTITTAAAHGVVAGDVVTIKGVVSGGTARANTTAYAVGSIFTSGGNAYRVIKAGTSAGAPPTFNTTAVGDVTQDGSAGVQLMGTTAAMGSILNYGEWDSRGFANGQWTVNTAPTGTTFTIVLPNAPGTYTSGGKIANLSKRFLSDFCPSGARVAVSPALGGKTVTAGVLDANDVTLSSVTGDPFEAFAIVKTANTAGADDADTAQRMVYFMDTTGGANPLPITPTGNNIDIAWDNGVNKIVRL